MRLARKSLQTYLILVFAAVMIPYLVLHAYMVETHVQQVRQTLEKRLHQNAKLSAGEVKHFLQLARTALADIAGVQTVAAMAQGGPCTHELPSYLIANPNLEAIGISDDGGRIRCSTGAVMSLQQIGDASRRSIGDNDFFVQAPLRAANGQWVAVLAYPVSGARGAVVALVDLLYFDSVHLRSALQEADLSPGSSVTVVNGQGIVVARWPDIKRWIGTDARRAEIGPLILSGNAQPFPIATGMDGQRKIYAHTHLPPSDWYLYSGIPVTAITGAAHAFRRNEGALTVLVVVATTLLAYFSGRFIARPITGLANFAHRAAGGDMSVRAPVRGSREVSTLAEQFNFLLAERNRAECALAAKQDELRRERNRALVTLGSIADGVVATDTNKTITYINAQAERLTGWHADEACGKTLNEVIVLVDEDDTELTDTVVSGMLMDCPEANRLDNLFLRRRDGTKLEVATAMACIKAGPTDWDGAVLVIRDLTVERDATRKLSWAARHDALTGLVNRKAFEELVRAALKRVRKGGPTCALLYIDLDRFKVVNDASGHRAGDELLRRLTDKMQQTLRGTDTLARIGGDEFAALLEDCTVDCAVRMAEALRQAMLDYRFRWGEKRFNIGASVGIVEVTKHSGSAESVIIQADTACHRAKDRGRNRVHVFRAGDMDIHRRMADMNWVRRAMAGLNDGSMRLYGQTIAPLHGTDDERCEVLLRLHGDEHVIEPDAFLPALERHGMMPLVDRWVVRTLFSGLRDKLYKQSAARYFVNLSGHSLNDEGFLEYVLQEFERTKAPPDRICFEVTETAAVSNFAHAQEFIARLTAFGCRFALDDFGSGMASFSYLRNLPADTLKISGNFVLGAMDESVNRAVVEAINDIGHTMNMATVAESAETHAIIETMREIGVDYVQGFGVEVPVPLNEWRKAG